MSNLKHPVVLTQCQHLAAFVVQGDDARSFLQSQLTQDVLAVTAERAALAGFCTAQGRLWASVLLAQQDDDALLGIASADLMDSFLKRLKMFVLRSKVTINPAPEPKIYGVEIGLDDVPEAATLLASKLPDTPWASQSAPTGLWIKAPAGVDAHVARFLLVADATQFERLATALIGHLEVSPTPQSWQVGDIKAGLAWVESATQDLFIAQTLNLDLIGGVSFTKGCYPGQEVIARAHYRGTVKRRMHLATVTPGNDDIKAGMDLFESGDPDNPVGRLINVATASAAQGQPEATWVLFEAPFKSVQTATLHVASADGPALAIKSLPYALGTQ